MQLVYLSATKVYNNRNAVRAEIVHNGVKYKQTKLFPAGDIRSEKLLFLRNVLKNIPWTKESVTIFLNDDQLYEDYTFGLFKNEQWPGVIACQDFFSLVISFRNKGILSDFLEEELRDDFSK